MQRRSADKKFSSAFAKISLAARKAFYSEKNPVPNGNAEAAYCLNQ